jgi:hypothetical protein
MQRVTRHLGLFSTVLGLLAAHAAISFGQPPPPAPIGGPAATSAIPNEDVLTRGPLHEAFAAPVNLSGAVAPTVPKRPPQPLNEAPADYRPEADGAVWIPGYWAWDDLRGDFIWTSGIWRNPPPGRQWVAGYWTQAAGSFQWTPGFWAPAETTEVQYFPQPPSPSEEAPPAETPSADAFWSPGCWTWQGNQFAWTSGFWTTGRQGWIWTPTSYSWTPRGYLLVSGYWDYTLDHRGLALAPVAISPAMYHRAGFVYTPSVVIDPGIFTFYLFARPAYCHYYFGDYFDARFDRLGFYPWYRVARGIYGYDPLFAYDRWYYAARDPHWIENLDRWHTYYRAHPDARPAHDMAQQAKFAAQRAGSADRRYLTIGQPLAKVARNPEFPVHVTALSAAERTRAVNYAHSHRDFQTQRSRLETGAVRTTGPGKAALPRPAHAVVEPRTTPRITGRDAVHAGTVDRPGNSPQPPKKEFQPHKEAANAPHPEVRQPEPQSRPQPRPEAVPRHPPAPNPAPAAHERQEHEQRQEHNPPPQHGEHEKKPI